MCSILCWILSIWEALGWIFSHFWLDSCIGLIHALSTGGEKFELEMACWMHLEGFQVVSSHFWALVCTGLTGRGQRSDRSECWSCSHVAHRSDRWCWPVRAELLQLPCFKWCLACIRLRGVTLGILHVCRGALCGLSSFGLVFWALSLSIVFSRMCRAVALA
jgi:hypothetical protein